MKKAAIIMIIITGVFAFTTLGLFIGRMTTDGSIIVHTDKSVRTETLDEEVTIPAGLININTATSEQLQELPGIGQAMAEEIIEYRKKNGPFETKRGLLKVKGIGEKTFEELKNMITVKDDN